MKKSFAILSLSLAFASASLVLAQGVVIPWRNITGVPAAVTAIGNVSTTSFGLQSLSLADAAAGRTLFGVRIGTDVQAYDSDLAAIAALTTTPFGRSLLTSADAAASRSTLSLGNVDNTSDASKPVSTATQAALDAKQPLDADLTAIAALATTSAGRSLLTASSLTAAGLSLTNGSNLDAWGAKTLPSGAVVGTSGSASLAGNFTTSGTVTLSGNVTVTGTGTGGTLSLGNSTVSAASVGTAALASIASIISTQQSFIFEGDSNTQGGAGPSPVSGGWPGAAQALPQIVNLAGGTIHNSAIGGSAVAAILARMPTTTLPYTPSGNATIARATFTVLGGTIDITSTGNVTATLAGLESIWTLAKSYGCTVVACTIQDRQDGGNMAVRAMINEGIRRSGTWDLLLDVDRILVNASDTQFFQADKLHWTAVANLRVAKAWDGLIASRSAPMRFYAPIASERLAAGIPMLNAAGVVYTGVNITAIDDPSIPSITQIGSASTQQNSSNSSATTGQRSFQYNNPASGPVFRQMSDDFSGLVRNVWTLDPSTGIMTFVQGAAAGGAGFTSSGGFTATGASAGFVAVGSSEATMFLSHSGAASGSRNARWRNASGTVTLQWLNDAGSGVTQSPVSITQTGMNVAGTFGAGNTTVTGTLSVTGNATASSLGAQHFFGTGTSPGFASGPGVGAGAPVTQIINSHDSAFTLNITTGSSPGTNAVIGTITFNSAYSAAPHAVLAPLNAATAALSGTASVFGNCTTTTFVLTSGSAGLTASTAYSWDVIILQ